MTLLEKADNSYWASQVQFSAWEAAFLTCNLEPFEEPLSLSSMPPQAVKLIRQRLLNEVPNCIDGTSIPIQGWSCRSERPVSTAGKVFNKISLQHWAQKQPTEIPLFLQ